MGKPSIRDVANVSGVSTATVSHVINGDKAVSKNTRDKVVQAIDLLGYKPNLVARSFKTGKRNLIAFIVPDIANPFFSTLIEEIESILSKENYNLIVANTKETKDRELASIKTLGSGFVDGFIIASTLEDYKEIDAVLQKDVPTIFIDRKLPNCPFETLCIDSFEATFESINYLINKGHTKIGYITGLNRISTTQERLRAYKEAMTKAGLDCKQFVRIGNSMSHCVISHLTSLIDSGCSAIVIANNLMATEALTKLLDDGMLAKNQIELVGFKDSDQPQYGLQHMSIINQPTSQLGKLAGLRILEMLNSENVFLSRRPITALKATFEPKGTPTR